MMGLGWADIERMSLWEYEARLYHWNEAHGGEEQVEAPDRQLTQKLIDRINSDRSLNP